MSKKLIDNLYRMSNPELIGLAKNRWLPNDVQMAIAKHHYRRAHTYLAENAGLDTKVRDYLWSDECNKGYVLKSLMITYGQYDQEPEKFVEFYEQYPSAWSRSPWRMATAFFGNFHWRSGGLSKTPSDLLNRIYDDHFNPRLNSSTMQDNGWSYGSSRYYLERMAKHENVDLKLAIKLSQHGLENIQRIGFNKIVELSK